MSKDIFSLSDADINNIITNTKEISENVKFSDIEGLFTTNFLNQLENLKEHKASFEDKIYQNLELAGDSEFVDLSEYEKLYLEDNSHLIDNLIIDYKKNILPQNPNKLWDKEGNLTMSLSNINEMRAKKESSLQVEIAYKLLFNKSNQKNPEIAQVKFATEYFKQQKDRYLYNLEFPTGNSDPWETINHNLLFSYIENGSDLHNKKVFIDFVDKLFNQLMDKTYDWSNLFESQEDYKKEKNYFTLIKALIDNHSTSRAALVGQVLAYRTCNMLGLVYCLKTIDKSINFEQNDVKRLIGSDINCVSVDGKTENCQMRYCDYTNGLQSWVFENMNCSKHKQNFFSDLKNLRFIDFQIVDNQDSNTYEKIYNAAIVYERFKGAVKLIYDKNNKSYNKCSEAFKFVTQKFVKRSDAIGSTKKIETLENPRKLESQFGFEIYKLFSFISIHNPINAIGLASEAKASVILKEEPYDVLNQKLHWFAVYTNGDGCTIHSRSNPEQVWTKGDILKPKGNGDILQFNTYHIVLKKYLGLKDQLFVMDKEKSMILLNYDIPTKDNPNSKIKYCVQIDMENLQQGEIYLHPVLDSPNQQFIVQEHDKFTVVPPLKEEINVTNIKLIKVFDEEGQKKHKEDLPKITTIDQTHHFYDLMIFSGDMFSIFKKGDDYNNEWIHAKSLCETESNKVKSSGHNCSFYMKLLQIDGGSEVSGQQSDMHRDQELTVPGFCVEKNEKFKLHNNEYEKLKKAQPTHLQYKKCAAVQPNNSKSILKGGNTNIPNPNNNEEVKKSIENELIGIKGARYVDAKFVHNSSKENKVFVGDSTFSETDVNLLIRWKAGDSYIFTFAVFTLDAKKTDIESQKFILKNQTLLKNDSNGVTNKYWLLEDYCIEFKKYKNLLLSISQSWENSFVCFNEDKSNILIIDRNTDAIDSTGAFGHVDLSNSILYHDKMALKSNLCSAKTEKYTIIGYDPITQQAITTLHITEKKKSFKHSTEPTRIRKYPIGFNSSGQIGCLFPGKQHSKVYQDEEESEVISFEGKTIDNDIYKLIGYCDISEDEDKHEEKNSKKEYVNCSKVCLKLLGDLLEKNPIGTISERKKTENYNKYHEQKFEKNVDYFRNSQKVCMCKDFLELLFSFLEQLTVSEKTVTKDCKDNNYDILCFYVMLSLFVNHLKIQWKARGQKPTVTAKFLKNVYTWANSFISLDYVGRTKGKLVLNSFTKKIKRIPFVGVSLLKHFERDIRLITFLSDSLQYLQWGKKSKKEETLVFQNWVRKDGWFESLNFTDYELNLFMPLFYDKEQSAKITKGSFEDILSFVRSIVERELVDSIEKAHDLDCTKQLVKHPELAKATTMKRSIQIEWIITKQWFMLQKQDMNQFKDVMKIYIINVADMLKDFDKRLMEIMNEYNQSESLSQEYIKEFDSGIREKQEFQTAVTDDKVNAEMIQQIAILQEARKSQLTYNEFLKKIYNSKMSYLHVAFHSSSLFSQTYLASYFLEQINKKEFDASLQDSQ